MQLTCLGCLGLGGIVLLWCIVALGLILFVPAGWLFGFAFGFGSVMIAVWVVNRWRGVFIETKFDTPDIRRWRGHRYAGSSNAPTISRAVEWLITFGSIGLAVLFAILVFGITLNGDFGRNLTIAALGFGVWSAAALISLRNVLRFRKS